MSDRVDWELALRVARGALGDPPAGAPPVDLEHLRDDAAVRIARRTGLDPGELPPIAWVDRGTWAAVNVASLRETLEPALEGLDGAPGILRGAAGAVLGAELGGLLAFVGRRVLGQLDVRLRGPDEGRQLLLVGPNVREAAARLAVDEAALTTWVGVHEVTHAVQFGGAPWLRDHLGGMLGELLAGAGRAPDLSALLRLDRADVLAFLGRVRDGGLTGAVLDRERRELLDRMQATMALVEGHAEWTMDAVGADLVPDVGALRAALERRRDARSPLLELVDRILGLELKLRQYREGRAFCDAVVAAGGEGLLAGVWTSPEHVPTPRELVDPALWVARMRPDAA
jgi:coenzyme F420 biosynthesis associated uncharacterized protein